MKNFFHPSKQALTALYLTLGFIALLALKILASLPVPSPVIFAFGLIGPAWALVTLFKTKEVSYAVWFPMVIGIFVLAFIIAEIAVPH